MPESVRIEGVPWCRHFDRAIDYRLVKEDRPPCIEERNGCGNCPECTRQVRRSGLDDLPVLTDQEWESMIADLRSWDPPAGDGDPDA